MIRSISRSGSPTERFIFPGIFCSIWRTKGGVFQKRFLLTGSLSRLRMTKALTEADGPSWREKLPPIPTVSLSDREKLSQKSTANAAQPNPTPKQNGTRQTNKPGENVGFLFL